MVRERWAIISEVERYYTEKVRAFGPTPKGVDWNDAESQNLRFEVLLRVLDGNEGSELLDFGCGYGALLDRPEIGAHRVRYEGRDVSADMVTAAAGLHKTCGVEHYDFRFSPGAQIEEEHDVIVASGIFNVKMTVPENAWVEHVEETIVLFAKRSRCAFAYNCLSDRSEPNRRRSDLHYANAAEHAEFVTSLGFEAEIEDGYGLYEFTILGRR